jgi:aspartyl-tRNA synthetase
MRSDLCGNVTEQKLDQQVEVCGWVDKRRDHGGVIFIDLRDHSGILQVVVEPDNEQAFKIAEDARYEYCLHVKGHVRNRPEGQANPNLKSGQIEVVVDQYEVLNKSKPLPFMLDDDTTGENVRLKHRYLDLRRPAMQKNMRLRSKLTRTLRNYLDDKEFLDLETPILTKATPEGARDFLVPSRVQQAKFYALPQSPQLFKQLLMMSGMDKYYQIARCFRDEDLRADRQPEFTQLDIEMSFVDQEDILNMAEGMIRKTYKEVMDVDLVNPFPRMTYADAMSRFGSDKPDMRIDLELVDVADALKNVEFKVFSAPANDPKGRVTILKVPEGCKMSRKQIDDYAPFVARYGARGLAWIKVNAKENGREGLQSPIVKFLDDDSLTAIIDKTQAQNGDLLFFGAGDYSTVTQYMGELRLKVAKDLGLVKEGWQPLWVVDFPMFDYNEDEKRWDAIHHPFTAPTGSIQDLQDNPGESISKGYDIVMNGVELGGGSIRIHKEDMQSAVLELLGISKEEADAKFGFLLEALEYGCPPHGGIALGLDRMAALMCGVESIREVIAFPKTSSAICSLTSAPSEISEKNLEEVHVKAIYPEVEEDSEKASGDDE